MWKELEANKNYETTILMYNILLLIISIREIIYKSYWNKPIASLHDNKKELYRFNQAQDATKSQYLDNFKRRVSLIEAYRGLVGTDIGLIQINIMDITTKNTHPTNVETAKATKITRRKYLGLTFCVEQTAHGMGS